MKSKTLLLGWIGASILYTVSLALIQRNEIAKELGIKSAVLTQQVSQRVDQHDAHLTGLSALAISGQEPNAALFLEVVSGIKQFYPRITAVDLVSLRTISDVITSRDGISDTHALHSAIQGAAQRSTGSLELMISPQHDDRYLIIKRVPNSDAARFALSFEIDTSRLVDIDPAFWLKNNVELLVSLPSGTHLGQFTDQRQNRSSLLFQPLTVTNTLQSRTQPLTLSTTVHVSANELFPVGPLVVGIIAIGLILLLLKTILSLYAKSRQAEKRARLGEHEARISHASRVNSLGELSSGIAHELTQPLTAILSQSQAGLRLIRHHREPDKTVVDILNANVIQAKRASNILARLRNWTKHSPESLVSVGVNLCVQNVLLLLDAEFKRLSVDLTIELTPADPCVMCDPVEFEQVVFNLTRNALDKQPTNDNERLSVTITTAVSGNQVVLSIKDDGEPVEDKMLDRIFEPFITAKDNGMGLGLALCDRIVSRMEGNIDISNIEDGVIARVTLPIHVQAEI
ncbi:MAG: hypothetical protein KDJ38_13845 [Gammaproteobacteria bacterium]|nr:hypothetical protein [Gammaproteobacteria bacterium]